MKNGSKQIGKKERNVGMRCKQRNRRNKNTSMESMMDGCEAEEVF